MIHFRAVPTFVVLIAAASLCACNDEDQRRGMGRLEERFRTMDRNGNGVLTADEVGRPRLFDRMDANGDGIVTKVEARAMVRSRLAGADSGGDAEAEDGAGRRRRAAARPPVDTAGQEEEANPPRMGARREFADGAASDSLKVFRDVPYAHVAGVDPALLSLDIYTSKDTKEGAPAGRGKKPVLVMIHGGGWKSGDKGNESMGGGKAEPFVEGGFVYVSINYRLSPAAQYPTPVRDAAKALAWVRGNIARYSGDPDRLYVMGHSAGAHLAALLATDESYLQKEGGSPRMIKGLVLLDSAAYDIPEAMEKIRPEGREMYLQAFGNDQKTWASASPTRHIAAGKGIPPMLVLHTDRPRSAEVSTNFVKALKSAGVPATAVEMRGGDHQQINRNVGGSGGPETRIILDFLRGKSLTALPTAF